MRLSPRAPDLYRGLRPRRLCLRARQVVELIFGEGLHDQVVRRCVELLAFLAMRRALDSATLGLIWRASLDKHESVRQAIYTVLVDLTVRRTPIPPTVALQLLTPPSHTRRAPRHPAHPSSPLARICRRTCRCRCSTSSMATSRRCRPPSTRLTT